MDHCVDIYVYMYTHNCFHSLEPWVIQYGRSGSLIVGNAWLFSNATLVDFKVLDKLTKLYVVKNDYKD